MQLEREGQAEGSATASAEKAWTETPAVRAFIPPHASVPISFASKEYDRELY
jgi:hypothetical protein